MCDHPRMIVGENGAGIATGRTEVEGALRFVRCTWVSLLWSASAGRTSFAWHAHRLNPAGRRRRGGSAFTLFEVILVVALIGVAATMFFVSVESLGKSSPADGFEGAFWRAMALAREQALTSRRPVELAFDRKEQRFLVAGAGGVQEVPLPVEVAATEADCAAVFSVELPSNDFILVRGELVTRRPVEAVKVFADGSCQAFAVDFQLRTYKHRVQIDPWTGAEMLMAEAAKKGRL